MGVAVLLIVSHYGEEASLFEALGVGGSGSHSDKGVFVHLIAVAFDIGAFNHRSIFFLPRSRFSWNDEPSYVARED